MCHLRNQKEMKVHWVQVPSKKAKAEDKRHKTKIESERERER